MPILCRVLVDVVAAADPVQPPSGALDFPNQFSSSRHPASAPPFLASYALPLRCVAEVLADRQRTTQRIDPEQGSSICSFSWPPQYAAVLCWTGRGKAPPHARSPGRRHREERACGGGRSAAPLTPLVCGWLATDAPAAERVPGQGVARARAGSRAGAGDDPDWRQAASGRRLPAALDLARRASGLAVGQQARELPERPADSGRALAVHRPLARASGPGAAAQECARDCGPT